MTDDKTNWPRIIFLNLDLEAFRGYEILEAIKCNEKFKIIPVVIYSHLANTLDINYSYHTLANAFIHLNNKKQETSQKIEQTCNYWLNLVHYV
jgi:PleD family two-component response regulator